VTFVLDTNVVSELRKSKAGKAHPKVTAWAASVPSAGLFISVITVLELEIGVMRLERRDPAQGAIMRAWMEGHVLPAFEGRVLPLDLPVALQCAKLHSPDPLNERDALIAATAMVHGMTVVTRDVADFERTGVSLLDPWNASGSGVDADPE
jgi:predicted nucleic acid-binding protein